MIKVAVVGAGPAGIAVAGVLATHGISATVIDEARQPGGQIYRRARAGLDLDVDTLLGAEAANYRNFHRTVDGLRDRIDYRPLTLAWGVDDRTLYTAQGNFADTVKYDALVLATGATDRTLPIPGWTLPGVFTLGGAQVLLKEHGCLIGRRVVFCGSSPLLYLAARQYRAMGAGIAAVLDTTPFIAKIAALPDLISAPATLSRGFGYMAEQRRAGVTVHHGVELCAFEGSAGVEAVRFRDRHARDITLPCDAVAIGFGLKPETQLADLTGAEFRYNFCSASGYPARTWMDDAAATFMWPEMAQPSAALRLHRSQVCLPPAQFSRISRSRSLVSIALVCVVTSHGSDASSAALLALSPGRPILFAISMTRSLFVAVKAFRQETCAPRSEPTSGPPKSIA